MGIRVFICHMTDKIEAQNLSQKYTISDRDQSHQRSSLPDTKFHVLYIILRSQDKNSNNSITLSSPALWKESRNTSKLNNYINYVGWWRSRTLLWELKLQHLGVFTPMSVLLPSHPSSNQFSYMSREQASPSDRSEHYSRKQLLQTTPWAPDSPKPQREVKWGCGRVGGIVLKINKRKKKM